MERLTEKRKGENVIPLRNAVYGVDLPYWKISGGDLEQFLSGDAADRLAAYEDTGLSPEEVKEIASWSYGPFHKKMGDWLKAEHEGRLVVLPCKFGSDAFIIQFSEEKNRFVVIPTIFRPWHIPIMNNVFPTREEAEAALRGVSEDA